MINPFAGLGKPRRHGDVMPCSLCDDPIPKRHAPLMLFANGRNLMWVYCAECELVVLESYKAAKEAGVS
jgi:hypothetical protein